jgi:RNA recognition motif-containing protein
MDRETGRSRGFGFVEMSENAGRKAITDLKDAEYDGRPLTVNEARPKTQGFGGGDRGRRSW